MLLSVGWYSPRFYVFVLEKPVWVFCVVFMGIQDVKQNDEKLPFYDVLMPWNLIMDIVKDWSSNNRYQSICYYVILIDFFSV